MNLYRSFGNLMEAWVNEGNLYPDPPTPSSDSGPNLRSQSVDSGVETASSDASFPASSFNFSSENAEIDAFSPVGQSAGLNQAAMSQSPFLSSPVPSLSPSSSPHLGPSEPQDSPHSLRFKLDQVQMRAESEQQKDNPEPLTVEEVLRRRPRASFLPKRHASELVKGSRKPGSPPVSGLRQISETCTVRRSESCDVQRLQELDREGRQQLSPGLLYLEQVCQLLEEIARQQMHNRTAQAEFDALRSQHGMPDPVSCPAAAEHHPALRRAIDNVENEGYRATEPQQRKTYNYGHFRQRSSSDTSLATLHLRQMNLNSRGQRLSTNDLLESPDEDHPKEEPNDEESKKPDKNWRLRFSSFKRESPPLTRGQSSEKNTARRRFSQLFRLRRKTMPI